MENRDAQVFRLKEHRVFQPHLFQKKWQLFIAKTFTSILVRHFLYRWLTIRYMAQRAEKRLSNVNRENIPFCTTKSITHGLISLLKTLSNV